VGAYEEEHTGVGGGRDIRLGGSLVEVEIGKVDSRDFGRRCYGVEATMMLRNGDLGGRDVCFGDHRRACYSDEQGDQEYSTPYQCG